MEGKSRRSRLAELSLMFAGILVFAVGGIVLENETGIPFDTTYRIGCAAGCLFGIAHFAKARPRERWPWIGFSIALVADVAMFFTPLLHGRSSRGEIMMFAAPDAVILLIARLATFRVGDEHQRAVRQQIVLGLVVALVLCAGLFASRLF